MAKFLAGLFIYVLAIGLGVLIMIYGYGVKPISWNWVIWGSAVCRLLIEVMSSISK